MRVDYASICATGVSSATTDAQKMVLELIKGKEIQRWHIPGTIYGHYLRSIFWGQKVSLNGIRTRWSPDAPQGRGGDAAADLQQQLRGLH